VDPTTIVPARWEALSSAGEATPVGRFCRQSAKVQLLCGLAFEFNNSSHPLQLFELSVERHVGFGGIATRDRMAGNGRIADSQS
jgi:hypothetical protein